MIDDSFVLAVERLRDSLDDARKDLRSRYKSATAQVVSSELRANVRKLAETWMVEFAPLMTAASSIPGDVLADMGVRFQRLLTYSEQAVLRRRYELELRSILTDFRTKIVIPLKQKLVLPAAAGKVVAPPVQKMFVGHSFAKDDHAVNDVVLRFLAAYGLTVVTGEKSAADTISAKVRGRIDGCEAFCGIFTRRDRVARKQQWLTSAWVVDEKAYALAKNKKLILLKESGVQSIGGLQGDYEFLEFERGSVGDLLVKLLETLRSMDAPA
jgi:hypothetical protein